MQDMRNAVFGAMIACLPSAAHGQATIVAPIQANPAPVLMVQKPAEVVSGSALPSNSEVWLSMDHELSSKGTKVGTKFGMTVARDVMLGQYVIIPRGTPAHGQVTYRTGKGAFGKSAKIEFDLIDIALASRVVPVSGHYRIEGQGNTGAAVGAAVAVGVFGAFVTGHSATVSQGSEWKANTKEPLIVSFAPDATGVPPVAPAGSSTTQAVPASATPAVVTKTS